MGEVDPVFYQEPEHRPEPHPIAAENIPTIDLSPILNPQLASDDSLSKLTAEIGSACKNWGFFQVINHGVPTKCREKLQSAAKMFFALPKEEKNKVVRDPVNPFGFYDGEHTKNIRDWKQVFDFAVEDPMLFPASPEPDDEEVKLLFNKWPENLPGFREACAEYTKEMEKLSFKLLELIALSLGLPKDRFNGFFKDQTSQMRLNYYPPCPAPELALGLGRHKDSSVLTILAQDDVVALEVFRKADGGWVLVEPAPDAYIINVGDSIQVWSNDTYESIEHRVLVYPEKIRYSIPYFMYPSHYIWIEPLKEMIDEQNPPKYKAYSWGKFRATRNRGNMRKLSVENIQISDYLI